MAVFIEAAKNGGKRWTMCFYTARPALGKRRWHIIAQELNVNIRITSGPAIERPGDLAALLTNLSDKDVLFIDEIHRLNSSVVEEVLYPAMEDYALDIILGKGPSARSMRIDLPLFYAGGGDNARGDADLARDRFGVMGRLQMWVTPIS